MNRPKYKKRKEKKGEEKNILERNCTKKKLYDRKYHPMQGKFKRGIKKIIKISMYATYYIYEVEYDSSLTCF